MYTIIMASGNQHSVTMCGAADGNLHIRMAEQTTFQAVVEEFANPENTKKITYKYGEMETIHEGYTTLILVRVEGENRFHIALEKSKEGGA